MFWKRDYKIIIVEMFDSETGVRVSGSKMPIERLPRSFEADTTLTIRDKNWQVVRAEPMTAEEFRKTGRLRVLIQPVRIEQANPENVLYSLPTISEEWPPLEAGASKLGRNVLEIHEDDWRQKEFVALAHDAAIEETLTAIRGICEHHREEVGFRQTHARRLIPQPVPESISIADLRAAAGDKAQWLDGISVAGQAGAVPNGFAVRLISSVEAYGLEHDGTITVLALQNTRASNVLDRDVGALSHFASEHQLCLIDWCRALRLMPQTDEFRSYFLAG